MHPNCVNAVNAIAGKPLSPAKLQAIEDAIGGKMRELARQDRARWQSLTHEQRMIEAATAAAQDVVAQAALKEARGLMQINRAAETAARVDGHKALTDLTTSEAWIRDIELSQIYIDQVRSEAVGSLGQMLDAVQIKDGAGFWRKVGMSVFDLDNPEQTRAIVREVFAQADGHTGNALAKQAAQAWLDTIEGMRVRFNGAGGDIGKLGYGYLSQHHDQAKIHAVRSGDWADKVLPLLDREQYLEADGSLTPVNKLRELLVAAHETLATGGDNKREPGGFKGTGARANRGSDARVLHFKDGDAWSAYMEEFGQGSLYDAMMGHVGRMARDIGLVERYGPNPEQTAKVNHDLARRADGTGSDNKSFGTRPEQRWALINGAASTPFDPTTAAIGDSLRSLQVAAKLGGAVISSLTDMGTIAGTLRFNRLPYFEYLGQLRKQAFDADTRAELQAHGVIGEALADSINRWTGENMAHSWAGRVAGSVMKYSFMNAWSDGLRRAFSMTMMKGFTSKLGKGWADLDEWDQHLLQRKGISEDDWSVISRAQAENVRGVDYLTPSAIVATGVDGARQIATKWGAFVSDEAQFAVINPDQATRGIATGGALQAGTIKGEAWRAAMQFKSFPMAMISRHWRRMSETPQGLEGAPMGYGADTSAGATANRVAMFAAFNVSLTLLGAAVLQVKSLLQGKDPMNMDPEDEHGRKFWAKALAQGGGMSFVADALLADPADGNTRTWENKLGLMGPVAGSVGGLLDVGPENLRQWLQGKNTNLGPEALRWINSNLPGVSLWQIRTLWQRAVIDQAQEALNPGYLSRMKQRAQKDWGSSWWWSPGEVAPDRAPDLEKIGG
jgi:hypothetical protein